MRSAITIGVVLLIVGFLAAQFSKMVRAKLDLTERVVFYLDFVDDTSLESVKDDLVKDAAKLGVDLDRDRISVVYRDTDQELAQQRLLGKLARFRNKQVAIGVQYHWRILGFGIAQEITRSKIKQVQVRQRELPPQHQELLE
jgi:hypothetical protein